MAEKPFPVAYILNFRDSTPGCKGDTIELTNMFSVEMLRYAMGKNHVLDLNAAQINTGYYGPGKVVIDSISSYINVKNECVFEIDGHSVFNSPVKETVVAEPDEKLKDLASITYNNKAKIVAMHINPDHSFDLYDDQDNIYYGVYLEQISHKNRFDGTAPISFRYRERDDTEEDEQEYPDV